MPASDKIVGIQLSELTAQIEGVIKKQFRQRYWVIADVTNHKFYSGKKRHYFKLVEKGTGDRIRAQVSAVAWKNAHPRIAAFERTTGQQFTNDINVLVSVTVDYHPEYGLKLVLQDISGEYTLGKLQQQRDEVLRQLLARCSDYVRKEGDLYITRNKKLEMRPVLQHIAVVGAANSAGMQDFDHTLASNEFGYTFNIDKFECRVQGAGGAELLRKRLIDIFNSQKRYDAVVMLRGGGAQTDFLMFDQYAVAQAVAKFPIPIISGIGHQKDQTIADLMAHTSIKTPTKAAEFIISRNSTFEGGINDLRNRVTIRVQRLLSSQVQRVAESNTKIVNRARSTLSKHKDETARHNRLVVQSAHSLINDHKRVIQNAMHQVTARPKERIRVHQTELSGAKERLKTGSISLLRHTRGYLGHHVSVIKLASPDNILRRGFAIVKIGEKIIVDQQQIAIGESIRIESATGHLNARVETKSNNYDPTTELRNGVHRAQTDRV